VKAACTPAIDGCMENVLSIASPTVPLGEPGDRMPIVGRSTA
jgi:hypothetical protein